MNAVASPMEISTICSARSHSEAPIEPAWVSGLAFSRWATEANHGQIYARNLPDVGCVCTVDLPRCPVPVPQTVNSQLRSSGILNRRAPLVV